MEIQVSEKQKSLIEQAINEQENLKQQAQAEFNKIQKRLDSIVEVILDSKGIASAQGIQYNDGKLIVPEVSNGIEDAKIVE